jgi:arylsulfatase A-like enzyme
MENRWFLRAVFLVCFIVGRTFAADRPNIVFIFSDDHAPHAIGACDGWLKNVNPTPNIDRLASEGMLFKNSFCTNSICGPSRAVIQTGKHSHLNGFIRNGNKFDGDQQTFPRLLQKAGYATAIIGKWHLGTTPQGYDYWKVLPGQGAYYNPKFRSPMGDETIEGYCTDIVTDLSLNWLEKAAADDKPFMLMCQHKAPHRNWMPPLRHLHLYDDVDIPEPATLFDRWEDNARVAQVQEMEIDRDLIIDRDIFGPTPDVASMSQRQKKLSREYNQTMLRRFTPEQLKVWNAAWEPKNNELRKLKLTGKDLVRWKYQRYVRNYLRCIKGVDESVGRITAWLREAGLEDSTIVIYSSDQGFYLGDHGWFDKRWMYEESLGMPLIIKWPGVAQPGTVNTSLVQNLDYAETFLEMAQAEIPPDMQGRSLVPLLEGETPDDWRKSIYYHYYEFPAGHMVAKHCGIRTDRYKLIHFYEFGEWEFYDLQHDPDELTNGYSNEQYKDIIQQLKLQLTSLQREYKDDSDMSEMPEEWKAQHLQADRR